MKPDEEYIRNKSVMLWIFLLLLILLQKRQNCWYTTKSSSFFLPPAQPYVSLGAGCAQFLGEVWRKNLWLNKIMWPCIQSCISHRIHSSLKIELQLTTYHLHHVAGSWFYSSPEGIMSVNNQLLLLSSSPWQSTESFSFLNWKKKKKEVKKLYFCVIWMLLNL